MKDPLYDHLQTLHTQNQPDTQFVEQLEQQLRDAHHQQKRFAIQPIARRLSAVAASLIIGVVLFMTVPPLRSLAQEIINFFIPAESFDPSVEVMAYSDVVIVDSIAEAESIAGFEALTWDEEGFHILAISATQNSIQITYEKDGDRGNLLIIIQYRTGSRSESQPVSPEASVQNVIVNGVEGQFVAGAWFGTKDGEPKWEPYHYRQLYWQQDGFSYHLLVALPLARTAEDTIEIAEKLR